MKRFLLEGAVVIVLIVTVHVVTAIYGANGYFDNFYLRFTTGKQSSMITGTSRSAQGMVPSVINKQLELAHPLYNYSFTNRHSPYGYAYFKSLQRKLDLSTKDGLFIVGVDPWSIAEERDAKNKFREIEAIPYIITNPNQKVNFEYLFKAYYRGWGNMILQKLFKDSPSLLHDDGWLEYRVEPDSAYFSRKSTSKLKLYTKYASTRKFSVQRMTYLRKTIMMFRNHGTVILVRLPVSEEFKGLEQEFMPEFDKELNQLASEENCIYLDFSGAEGYLFNDGNHMNRHSSKRFSMVLADSLKTYIR